MVNRLLGAEKWVRNNYQPGQDPISLVCSSMSMLDVFMPSSKHTVFYQLPRDPELVANQKQYLIEGDHEFAIYGKFKDLKTFTDSPTKLSFATGTTLEPPFQSDTFDNIYFDFEFGMVTPHSIGYSWENPGPSTLVALAEYLEKLKPEGHMYSRAPIANAAFVDYVDSVFEALITNYFNAEVEKRITFRSEDMGEFAYDLMMKVRKSGPVDAKGIREQVQKEEFEMKIPERPNATLLTLNRDLVQRLRE